MINTNNNDEAKMNNWQNAETTEEKVMCECCGENEATNFWADNHCDDCFHGEEEEHFGHDDR